MKSGRTLNSLRNIIFGVMNQFIIIILGFISRAFFLKYLDETYLGINSLFTEVLSVLSLADLGINTVMVYSFYKPLAESDIKKLTALLTFFKSIYRAIAIVVTILGILILPFLNYIIKLDEAIRLLNIYYIIFLSKTVLSYMFVYRASILNADQKGYILNYVTSCVNIITTFLQITVLVYFKSYLLFLLLNVLSILANNCICAKKAEKIYPFIKSKEKLSLNEKAEIFLNIKSGFLYKLSSVLINSTDNILISAMLGTATVGYYSNYGLVINKLSTIINIIFSSMVSSIGNLMVTESREKKYQIFSIMQMLSFWGGGITCVCVFMMMDDLILLWIGEKYILNMGVLSACVVNFYLSIVLQPLWTYREATGLYQQTKNVMLCTAGLNIILSIFLGQFIGLSGIIFASALSRLFTYCWYEPLLLFKQYFHQCVSNYFFRHIYNIVIILIIIIIEHKITNKIICKTWIVFIGKSGLVLLMTFIFFMTAYFWRNDFKVVLCYIRDRLKCL